MIIRKIKEMAIANDNKSDSVSDISVSCISHMICFAAEESRLSNTVINMDKYNTV